MLQTEALAGQTPIKMRINIAAPVHDFANDFAPAGTDAIMIAPAYFALTEGSYGPGDVVPIVRSDLRITFELAHWGYGRQDRPMEYFGRCTGQRLGYPALIPASSIDVIDRAGQPVRFTGAKGENLYVGCQYFQVSRGAPISVVPLFREAGPDIAPYSDLQPLLLPIHTPLKSGILAFIDPQDGAMHLRRSSPAGTIKMETLEKDYAAPGGHVC
jgi:hypothetical protein